MSVLSSQEISRLLHRQVEVLADAGDQVVQQVVCALKMLQVDCTLGMFQTDLHSVDSQCEQIPEQTIHGLALQAKYPALLAVIQRVL